MFVNQKSFLEIDCWLSAKDLEVQGKNNNHKKQQSETVFTIFMIVLFGVYLGSCRSPFFLSLIRFLIRLKKSTQTCRGLKGFLAHLKNDVGEDDIGCTCDLLYGPFFTWFELETSKSGEGESFLLWLVCWGRFCECVIPAYIFNVNQLCCYSPALIT